MQALIDERSYLPAYIRWLLMPLYKAGTPGRWSFYILQYYQHIFQIARIGNHHHARSACHGKIHTCHHAVYVEEQDGVKTTSLPGPIRASGFDLERIGDHIALHSSCADTPVVPPEYWNNAVSSGPTSTFGREASLCLASKSWNHTSPSRRPPSILNPPFFSRNKVNSTRITGVRLSLRLVTINLLILVLG